MTTLFAPAGLRSLGIGDRDYVVGEDGTVEIEEGHVAAAFAHGCRHEKPAPAPVEPEISPDVVGELESRVAALEARLAQLEADGARRRKG